MVARLVVGSIPTRGNEIFTLSLNLHFFALVSRQSAALSSATQYPMTLKFGGGKWGTECLNTRFPLPTDLIFLLYYVNILDVIYIV